MPVYYFDTSALAKHYQRENGTAVVDAILANPANRVVVGRIGLTEVISAMTRRVRIGELPASSLPALLQRLRQDVALKRFGIVRMLQPHFASAEKIIAARGPTHQVRTLDALHLSVALAVHQAGGIAGFICSDERLKLVAAGEGLIVIDPENPPAGFTP
jgi:predicted nucleic acid-binding protein